MHDNYLVYIGQLSWFMEILIMWMIHFVFSLNNKTESDISMLIGRFINKVGAVVGRVISRTKPSICLDL